MIAIYMYPYGTEQLLRISTTYLTKTSLFGHYNYLAIIPDWPARALTHWRQEIFKLLPSALIQALLCTLVRTMLKGS